MATHLVSPLMRVCEVTVAGNWVTLEPLRPSHADELFQDAMEPELFRYLSPGAEQSKQALRDWIVRRVDEQSHGASLPFLQRDSVSRKAFGATCMTNISTRHHRGEIGHTWLAKSHRKTPANTEAKLLLLTHAFETMRCVRIQFKVDVRNVPAQQALERIGAMREGRMRNERVLNDGFIRDAFVYSIIDLEWPDVKTRLNGLLWSRPETVPAKPAPPPIAGLEATLRPAAAAFKNRPAPLKSMATVRRS
ncbi:MAG: GNAT family N-acetyltransferase [Thermoplasmatota archaeon]